MAHAFLRPLRVLRRLGGLWLGPSIGRIRKWPEYMGGSGAVALRYNNRRVMPVSEIILDMRNAHSLIGGYRPRSIGWVSFAVVALLLMAGCGTDESDQAASEPSLEQGAVLYEAHCLVCHGGETGGQITDVPPPHNAAGHTWHHGDCELLQMITEGNDEFRQGLLHQQGVPREDSIMPAFEDQLAEEEAEAILAYIKTWWTEEQREFQARATEQLC
jgi:mono/diheme cytochrome c family protein